MIYQISNEEKRFLQPIWFANRKDITFTNLDNKGISDVQLKKWDMIFEISIQKKPFRLFCKGKKRVSFRDNQ